MEKSDVKGYDVPNFRCKVTERALCCNHVILETKPVRLPSKGKAEHLYSALYGIQTTLKQSGMDHTVLPAINTMLAFYIVSVHQMAPPPIEVTNI